MTDLGATLRLAAIGRVVERLLRESAETKLCPFPPPKVCLTCTGVQSTERVASELRAILDADVPAGETPLQVALAELAAWSMKHRAVDPVLVGGAMLAEVIALQRHQQGATWGDFVAQAFGVWNASEDEDQGDG